MKNIVRVVSVVFFAALLSAPALAQTAVPPPPRPADNGPSLAVTMKFIQGKLNDIGAVRFALNFQKQSDGTVDSNNSRLTVGSVVADPSTCQVTYSIKAASFGFLGSPGFANLSLKDAQDVVVEPIESFVTQRLSRGNPDLVSTGTNPPITAMVVRRPNNVFSLFPFQDAALADRVARAMVHAIELCGGGNNTPKSEEPF